MWLRHSNARQIWALENSNQEAGSRRRNLRAVPKVSCEMKEIGVMGRSRICQEKRWNLWRIDSLDQSIDEGWMKGITDEQTEREFWRVGINMFMKLPWDLFEVWTRIHTADTNIATSVGACTVESTVRRETKESRWVKLFHRRSVENRRKWSGREYRISRNTSIHEEWLSKNPMNRTEMAYVLGKPDVQ